MGLQIIIQPNKKLCVWNSMTQTIDVFDCSTDDVVDYMVELSGCGLRMMWPP